MKAAWRFGATRPYVDVAVRDFALANRGFKKLGRFQESVVARWRVEGHAEQPGNHFDLPPYRGRLRAHRLATNGSVRSAPASG
jgi:hypothetical protein